MALLTVKPSRGAVLFFVALALALAGRAGWQRHEETLVQRDAPVAHQARRLLRCVLGGDAQRLLWPRAQATSGGPWEIHVANRLRRVAASAANDASWPSRCVPLADRLATRLETTGEAQAATGAAREVAWMLADAARNRLAAIERAENGTLATRLTDLAVAVSHLSDGSEAGWESPLAAASTDLNPLPDDSLALLRPLPGDSASWQLVRADVLLYQRVEDSQSVAIEYDRDERAGAPHAVSRGVPVARAGGDGAALVADDTGDAVYLPAADPQAAHALPDELREGREGLGDWQAIATPSYLWLMSDDHGVLRVRARPRDPGASWSPVLLRVGERDGTAGGALWPEPSRPDLLRLVAVRRGASGVWLEQYTVPSPATSASAPSATRAMGSTSASGVTRTPSPAASPAPTVLLPEWAAYAPRVTQCAGGRAHYLIVTADDRVTVVALHDERPVAIPYSYDAAGAPTGGRFAPSCGDAGVLLYADLANRPGALVFFDARAGRASLLAPPLFRSHRSDNPRVVGGVLTASHGATVVVDHGTGIRAYRNEPPGSSRWTGGELVALQRRVDELDTSGDDTLEVEVRELVAHEDRVALLADVVIGPARAAHREAPTGPANGPARFVSRLGSGDGGVHWR